MARNGIKLILSVAALSAAFAAPLSAADATDPTDPDYLSKSEIISADALKQLQDQKADFLLFDARGKRDYDQTHIAGAVLPLPLKFYNEQELFKAGIVPKAPDLEADLAEAMKAYPKDKRFVTYCNRNCTASAHLLKMMKRLGFANVQAMTEGIQAWEEKGYPVVVTT